MKRFWTRFIFLTAVMLSANSLLAQVTTIAELDDACVFSFAVFSDNRGSNTTTVTARTLDWVQNNHEFCLGNGDILEGNNAEVTRFRNILKTNTYYKNNFFPTFGNHCSTYTGTQTHWGRIAPIVLPDLNLRGFPGVEFRVPGTEKVKGSQSVTYPDVIVDYDDQYIDYYVQRTYGSFTVHIISVYKQDRGVFYSKSADFLYDKMVELVAAGKTTHDLIVVQGHDERWLYRSFSEQYKDLYPPSFTRAKVEFIAQNADLYLFASDHRFRRGCDFDRWGFDMKQVLEVDTGQVIVDGASDAGYCEFHVFDNPPRFTAQYINAKLATRQLHSGMSHGWRINDSPSRYETTNLFYPMMKYVSGDIVQPLEWADFVAVSESNYSTYVSQTAPSTLFPGETAAVSVTVKNRGLDAWSAADGQKLGSQNPENNTLWGLDRVELPQTVGTNQECTFSFDITAPTNSGTYNFQWQMVDESGDNQGWFGVLTPNIPIAVAWPISNLVKNASFEEGAATPDFWNVSANLSRSSQDAADGLFSLKGTASYTSETATQTIALATNTVYNLSVRINYLSGSTGMLVFDTNDRFDDQGNQFTLYSSNGGWQLYQGSFNSGTNTEVTLRAYTAGFNGTFYLDDVVLSDPTVEIHNHPPAFTSTPGTFAEAGVLYTYSAQASDADSNPLTFDAVIKPDWLTIDAGTGVLSGTPSTNDIGSSTVALRVSDGTFYAYQSFTLVVSQYGNDAPEITSQPVTGVVEDDDYSYTFSAVDVDGDSLTYSAPVKPSWISFNAETGVLSGTPSPVDVGLHPVTLTVSDGTVTVTQQFNIAVFATPVPDNLVLNGSFEQGTTTPTSWTVGLNSTRSTAAAQDGIASLRLLTNPGYNTQVVTLQPGTDYTLSLWLNVDGMTAGGIRFDTYDKFDGTTNGLGGDCQFTIDFETKPTGWTQYTGTFNSSNETSVTLRTYKRPTVGMTGTVYFDNIVLSSATGGNGAPVVTSIPVTNAVEGTAYNYTLLAADPENDPLVFAEVSVPAWSSFNTNSGVLSGTPSGAHTGSHPVSLRVSDGSLSVTQNFTIVVAAAATSGYEAWAATNGITGGPTDDDDGDGLNNLSEYAVSEKPMLVQSGDTFDYVHLQRNDDPNLIYTVETATNLISNVWTNVGGTAETNVTGGVYDEVTHHIPVDDTKSYIRLRITNQ